MIEKLKQIYRNKIIENVKTFDYDKYYYFFKPGTNNVFGIERGISENEYFLIKTNYIEKKIYDNNNKNQLTYEYLFEDKTYPFQNKLVKLLILDINKNHLDVASIKDILNNFYKEVIIINLDNIYIAFCMESYQIDLANYVSSINFDLGQKIKFHEGIFLNQNIKGSNLLKYITIIKQFLNNCEEDYTDLMSPLINSIIEHKEEYANFIYDYIVKNILNDPLTKDIIQMYFKNDLNVSKTAKDLYINRNSLLNKFEHIFKETGINLQKFSHACVMYLYLVKHQ